MTTKTPTASGVSRLLAAAGFTRADIDWGHAGFQVTKCNSRAAAVKVRQYFPVSGAPESRYGDSLRRYAKAIEAKGYATEAYTYHLIVTAKAED
jgi:hypothetical protein